MEAKALKGMPIDLAASLPWKGDVVAIDVLLMAEVEAPRPAEEADGGEVARGRHRWILWGGHDDVPAMEPLVGDRFFGRVGLFGLVGLAELAEDRLACKLHREHPGLALLDGLPDPLGLLRHALR